MYVCMPEYVYVSNTENSRFVAFLLNQVNWVIVNVIKLFDHGCRSLTKCISIVCIIFYLLRKNKKFISILWILDLIRTRIEFLLLHVSRNATKRKYEINP
jgi:hypothetical protein